MTAALAAVCHQKIVSTACFPTSIPSCAPRAPRPYRVSQFGVGCPSHWRLGEALLESGQELAHIRVVPLTIRYYLDR